MRFLEQKVQLHPEVMDLLEDWQIPTSSLGEETFGPGPVLSTSSATSAAGFQPANPEEVLLTTGRPASAQGDTAGLEEAFSQETSEDKLPREEGGHWHQ